MAATKSSHFIDGNRVLCVLHNVGPLSVSHPHNFTILAINFDLFIAKRTDELTGSNNFKADSQKFCLEQFEFPASATSRSIKRWILPNDLFFCDVIDYGVVKSWMQVDKSWDEISTFRFWVRQLCLHFVSRGWRSGEGWPDWRIWRISRISRETVPGYPGSPGLLPVLSVSVVPGARSGCDLLPLLLLWLWFDLECLCENCLKSAENLFERSVNLCLRRRWPTRPRCDGRPLRSVEKVFSSMTSSVVVKSTYTNCKYFILITVK